MQTDTSATSQAQAFLGSTFQHFTRNLHQALMTRKQVQELARAVTTAVDLRPGGWVRRLAGVLSGVKGVQAWNQFAAWAHSKSTVLPQPPDPTYWDLLFPTLFRAGRVLVDEALVLGGLAGLLELGLKLNTLCGLKSGDVRYDPRFGCLMIFFDAKPDGRGVVRRFTHRAATAAEQVYFGALRTGIYGPEAVPDDGLLLPGSQPTWWRLCDKHAFIMAVHKERLKAQVEALKAGRPGEPGGSVDLATPVQAASNASAVPQRKMTSSPRVSAEAALVLSAIDSLDEKAELTSPQSKLVLAALDALEGPSESELAAGVVAAAAEAAAARRSRGASSEAASFSRTAPPAEGFSLDAEWSEMT